MHCLFSNSYNSTAIYPWRCLVEIAAAGLFLIQTFVSIQTFVLLAAINRRVMDSELHVNGRLVFRVDRSWREDACNLPDEDIYVPSMHLPDPEPDNSSTTESLKEMDLKWTDLALNRISSDTVVNNNA